MYGDEVKADTTLRDVMRTMSAPPTANPLPRPSYRHSFVRPFAYMYTLLPTNGLYAPSCLLSSTGRSDSPLGTSCGIRFAYLLTCGYAAKPNSYSSHVIILTCHWIAPLLVAHGALGPLMTSLAECCMLPPVQLSLSLPCDLVGFPLVVLEKYNAPDYVMSHVFGHACLSFVGRLEGTICSRISRG